MGVWSRFFEGFSGGELVWNLLCLFCCVGDFIGFKIERFIFGGFLVLGYGDELVTVELFVGI